MRKLQAAGEYVNPEDLQLKAKIEKEIFLHNHEPLIYVLEGFGCNIQNMTLADIENNLCKGGEGLAEITKLLRNLLDFQDTEKRHPPKPELYAFVQTITIKGNTVRTNLDDLTIKQHKHQASGLDLD